MTDASKTHPSFLIRLRDQEDELSWFDFHARYGHMLYRYARARGASHTNAEDIVQEVEMQLFQTMDGFEYDVRKGKFRSYLRTAVIHALTRRADKECRQPAGLDPRLLDSCVNGRDADRDEEWMREWRLHLLRRTVQEIANEFDSTTLKAFEMCVLAGKPVADTAGLLDISIWSVYRARKRVLERLKSRLGSLDPDEDS